MSKKVEKNEWVRRWKQDLKPTQFPGVWKRQTGGHFVRAHGVNAATGQKKEIKKVLPDADAVTALNWLEAERQRLRSGSVRAQQATERFAEYAASLFEQKKAPGGEIQSEAGVQRWKSTLNHLIAGTAGPTSGLLVPGLGEFFVEKLTSDHVDEWRTGVAKLIAAGDYSPTTANGWLSILRVINKAARRKFKLSHDALDGIKDFDLSQHATHTEEEPNALPVQRVGEFLQLLREHHPQHYANTFLGFISGLRPSSMRPLRRRGPKADILWDQNRILIRQSQTRGPKVMQTTKQKRRYGIDVPPAVMAVLRWHVETQFTTPEQHDSDLLFPSLTGSFRAANVLNKPFAEVAEMMGLRFAFTQSGMRRTFNDLARHAKVEGIVTRSISGHLTEQMHEHYSTVAPDEQRQSIAKVINLFGGPAGCAPSCAPASSGCAPTG